jgi:hypothetical protein
MDSIARFHFAASRRFAPDRHFAASHPFIRRALEQRYVAAAHTHRNHDSMGCGASTQAASQVGGGASAQPIGSADGLAPNGGAAAGGGSATAPVADPAELVVADLGDVSDVASADARRGAGAKRPGNALNELTNSSRLGNGSVRGGKAADAPFASPDADPLQGSNSFDIEDDDEPPRSLADAARRNSSMKRYPLGRRSSLSSRGMAGSGPGTVVALGGGAKRGSVASTAGSVAKAASPPARLANLPSQASSAAAKVNTSVTRVAGRFASPPVTHVPSSSAVAAFGAAGARGALQLGALHAVGGRR